MERAEASPRGGIIRRAKRPEGWRAPGPRPAGPGSRTDLWPGEGEDLCYLSGEWRIFQRLEGHRWSLDDLVTAWYALEAVRHKDVRGHIDLGCGIGSVLMMVAWRMPGTCAVGVEAQGVSAELAKRSIAYNGIDDHVTVRRGDLRDPDTAPEGAVYDLVTGTPPYIPLGSGNVSERVQCGPCRHEMRGGIEAYCEAASRVLAPGGRFVVCEGAGQDARVQRAAQAHGLTLLRQKDVVPRCGRKPLFSVYAMARADEVAPRDDLSPHRVERPLTVRDAHGERTRDYLVVRAAMGMPP